MEIRSLNFSNPEGIHKEDWKGSISPLKRLIGLEGVE